MSIRAFVYTMASVATFYGFSAAAATVTPFSGDVFVSQGNGFHKINGATLVTAGDSVMVSPDGLAQVRLDYGNIITVVPGKVLSVPLKAQAKDAALPDGAGATADYPVPPPAAGAAAPANQSSAGGVAGAAGLASPPNPISASPE